MPITEAELQANIAAVSKRAEIGYIGADSIDFFTDDAPQLVTVEVRGDGDKPGTCWHGEVVLTKEATCYAIWALAKSIGLSDEAEAMLKAAGVEED